ncbi:phage tail sheath subtilisin-like domain-containing protein [Luteimonas soli]|uniref:Phage tail sheath subtilisin-like domain-containing protein n=1 Tax=Luteimonas soli TaxID=1648966 RepID=A0ABV7XPM6_9GAMM
MTISFNAIPIDIRTPGQYIEFDNSRALRGLPAVAHKVLVIGQRLATGNVDAGVPTRILSAAQAEAAFGAGSMLAAMLAAFKAANGTSDVTAIALDDLGAGAAAAGSVAFTGPATAAGTLNLYIGGVRVQVGVTAAMTAAQLATATAAAINAATHLPVTAEVNGSDTSLVDITARHKGESGNGIDLRANYALGELLPAGIGATFVAMSGGTGNPDIATAIAAMADTQYATVVVAYNDATNLAAIEAELADRWGPMVQLEGHAFAAVSGTHAALVTLGDARNSPHLTLVAAGKSPTPAWIWAAVCGAVDAAEPDPARPRQTLPLPGLLAPASADRFTREERDLLLHDGIATTTVDAGDVVRVERFITTYQESATGEADVSYLDIETVRTLAYLRATLRARIALRYPRHKLADDGTLFAPGQAVATPKLIKAEILHLFREWEGAGLVEGFEQFKADLIVERNATDANRIDALIPPNVVNQLRIFAGLIQFRL